MRTDRRRLLLGAAAAVTTGAAAVGALNGSAAATGTVESVDVRSEPYGAKGDGVTDDTAAIVAALADCAPGGVVLLPGGTYLVSAPLPIPPQVTLQGTHAMHLDTTPCAITPGADFTGDAVLLLLDQGTGGYSLPSNEQRILNLSIDGAALPAGNTVDGIRAVGFVHGVVLQDVGIINLGGRGIAAVANGSGTPYSWRGTRIVAKACAGHGFSLSMTDCTWIDLEAIGCGKSGFYVAGAANSHFVGCRAEWNGNHGIELTGGWWTGNGAGGCALTSFSTDRNNLDGVHIEATGTSPVVLNGLMLRRDGRNGGTGGAGYAGLRVAGATVPVVVNGITVYPGTDDGGGTALSPQYAVSVAKASFVALNGGWLHAAGPVPIHDGGGNSLFRIDPTIGAASGTTAAPVAATAVTAAVALGARAAGDSADRLTVSTTGSLGWGGGQAAADAFLRRQAAGVLATDGLLMTGQGLRVQDVSAVPAAPTAGSTGLFSRNGVLGWIDPSGRVFPLDDSSFASSRPSDQNLAAWNYDPLQATAGSRLVSGTVYLVQFWLRRTTTVSRLWVGLAAAGAGLVTGGCRLGLVDGAAGTVLGSSDVTSAFRGTAGAVSAALATPRTLAPGRYYVAVLARGTTPPALARTAGTVAALDNRPNSSAATARFAVNGTGRTSLPTSFAMASNVTTTAGITFWAAVS